MLPQDERKEGLIVEIADVLFARNRATGYLGSGGAIRMLGRGVSCTLTDSVLFTLNTANLDGGGVHLSELISANISAASFIGNEALNGGGAALFVLVRSRPFEASISYLWFFAPVDSATACCEDESARYRHKVPLQSWSIRQPRRRVRRRHRSGIRRHIQSLQFQGQRWRTWSWRRNLRHQWLSYQNRILGLREE